MLAYLDRDRAVSEVVVRQALDNDAYLAGLLTSPYPQVDDTDSADQRLPAHRCVCRMGNHTTPVYCKQACGAPASSVPGARTADMAGTEQVRLMPVRDEDVALLERFLVDDQAAGPWAWSGFAALHKARRRFEADGYLADDNSRLIVLVGDQAVGFVSWVPMSHGPPESRCWQIGIGLLPEHRGRGVGAAAQRLLVEYLFATTTAVRIEAGTLFGNVAEQRALERAGFALEGRLRSAQYLAGQWQDLLLYSRLRSDAPTSEPAD